MHTEPLTPQELKFVQAAERKAWRNDLSRKWDIPCNIAWPLHMLIPDRHATIKGVS